MTERREIHFFGQVQGVGFRYSTQSVAARFEVVGFVQNLPDGRVRIVVEGESAEIDRFLDELDERMAGYIRERTTDRQPATGTFSGFSIKF